MNSGDAGAGLIITGAIVGSVVAVAGMVYLVVTVAKWAWGG